MNPPQSAAGSLTLIEAARLLTSATRSVRDAEALLAEAIQRGQLHANVMRWATEQWDGRQLPGNINPRETRIERSDFDAWRQAQAI